MLTIPEVHRGVYLEDKPQRLVVGKEWISQQFPQTVKVSNSDIKEYIIPDIRELPKKTISHFPFEDLVVKPIEADLSLPVDEQILSVLMHSHIRRGSLEIPMQYKDEFLSKIHDAMNTNRPIEIVLPTLPFKNQNVMATGHSIGWTDLGEYLCMLQMKTIVESVKKVYAPGAKITLLTDGTVYADLFANGDKDSVGQYFQQLWHIKEKLGLGNDVELVDMQWLINTEPLFADVAQEIRTLLPQVAAEDETVAKLLQGLTYGMLFCFDTPFDMEEYMKRIFVQGGNLPKDILSQAMDTAHEYATFLLTMKKLDVVKKAFPHAIRGTVHCKDAAQIPLHLVNHKSWIFPYHGVPVVSRGRQERIKNWQHATRIIRLCEVYNYPSATAVYLPGEKEPFYYEVD